MPRDFKCIPSALTGSQGLESIPRPHRFPGLGGMGGIGSPSSGVAEERAGVPQKPKTHSLSLLGRGETTASSNRASQNCRRK